MNKMKHIKLYESFITDINNQIEHLVKASKAEINLLMQTLMDDYGFHFSAVEIKSNKIVSFVYDAEVDIQLTDEFIKQLSLLEKKCKEYDLIILIPHLKYSSFEHMTKDKAQRSKEISNITIDVVKSLVNQVVINRLFIKICDTDYLKKEDEVYNDPFDADFDDMFDDDEELN